MQPALVICAGGRDYAVESGGVGLGDHLLASLHAIATGCTADAAGAHPWTKFVGDEAGARGGEGGGRRWAESEQGRGEGVRE